MLAATRFPEERGHLLLRYLNQIQAYHRELDKGHDKDDEVIEAFAEMAKGLAVMNPQFGELATMMENGERIGSKMAEGLMRIQGGMINAGMAAKQFAQNQ